MEPKFSPGFRLSALDVAIFAAGILVTVFLERFDFWIGLAVAFVVGHFFLFCNVLRMSRKPELIWAITFAALAIAASVPHLISWPLAFCVAALLTVVLAIVESRRPSYHGVLWRRFNLQLPGWWSNRAVIKEGSKN